MPSPHGALVILRHGRRGRHTVQAALGLLASQPRHSEWTWPVQWVWGSCMCKVGPGLHCPALSPIAPPGMLRPHGGRTGQDGMGQGARRPRLTGAGLQRPPSLSGRCFQHVLAQVGTTPAPCSSGSDLRCHGNSSIRAECGTSWHPKGQRPEQGAGSPQLLIALSLPALPCCSVFRHVSPSRPSAVRGLMPLIGTNPFGWPVWPGSWPRFGAVGRLPPRPLRRLEPGPELLVQVGVGLSPSGGWAEAAGRWAEDLAAMAAALRGAQCQQPSSCTGAGGPVSPPAPSSPGGISPRELCTETRATSPALPSAVGLALSSWADRRPL